MPETTVKTINFAMNPSVWIIRNIQGEKKQKMIFDLFLRQFKGDVLPVIQEFSLAGRVKSTHQVFNCYDLFYFFLAEHIDAYQRHYPEDRAMEGEWNAFKIALADYRYDTANNSQKLFAKLDTIKEKLRMTGILTSEESAQMSRWETLIKNPNFSDIPLAVCSRPDLQVPFDASPRMIPIPQIQLPVCSVYQAYRMHLTQLEKDLRWFQSLHKEFRAKAQERWEQMRNELINAASALGETVEVESTFDKSWHDLTRMIDTQPIADLERIDRLLTDLLTVCKQLQAIEVTDLSGMKAAVQRFRVIGLLLTKIVWHPGLYDQVNPRKFLLEEHCEFQDKISRKSEKETQRLMLNPTSNVIIVPDKDPLRITYFDGQLPFFVWIFEEQKRLHPIFNYFVDHRVDKTMALINGLTNCSEALLQKYARKEDLAGYLTTQLHFPPIVLGPLLQKVQVQRPAVSPVALPSAALPSPKRSTRRRKAAADSRDVETEGTQAEYSDEEEVQKTAEPALSKPPHILMDQILAACNAQEEWRHFTPHQGKAYYNSRWHLDNLQTLWHTLQASKGTPINQRLNVLTSLCSSMTWGLEQSLRFTLLSRDPHLQNLPNHDLKMLFGMAYPSAPLPAIIRKLRLGNHWCRYFFEEHETMKNYTTFNRPMPALLKMFQRLAHNPASISQEEFDRLLTSLMTDFTQFLSDFPAGSASPLPKHSGFLEKAPLSLSQRFDLKRTSPLIERIERILQSTSLPLSHPIVLLLKQSKTSLEMLSYSLANLNEAKNNREFALWINRSLFLLQEILERTIQCHVFLHTGEVKRDRHEIGELALLAGVDPDEAAAVFQGMGEKSRYPARTFAGQAAHLMDQVELFRQFPLASTGFAPVSTFNREHWTFPAEAHGGDKLIDGLNRIFQVAEKSLNLLLPRLEEKLRKI